MTDPMIVEFVRVAEQGFNWTPVFQTAVGTFFGFVLSLIAYLIQRWITRRSEERQRDNAANDALKRALACATSNIEVVAMLKMQLLEALQTEVEVMRPLVDKAFESDAGVAALVEQSGKLRHFYKTLPRAYELDPPPFSELARVLDDMPALTTYLHRGMSSLEELQAISIERNHMLSDHAKENADGMNGHRVRYFGSMLTDMGEALTIVADNAAAFFALAREQIESYLIHKAKVANFRASELLPEVKKRMPSPDRFPELRKLLVDFKQWSKKK